MAFAAAGCSSFDPNPAATGQAPPPVAVAATPAGTPATTPPARANAVPELIVGLAENGGTPIVNAPFTVHDALTNAPIADTRQVTVSGVLPAGEMKSDRNGLLIFSLPTTYQGELVRVVVKTPEGAYLNTLLAVERSAKGYRLRATGDGCGSNPEKVSFTSTMQLEGLSSSSWDDDSKQVFAQSLANSLGVDMDRVKINSVSSDSYRLAATCDASKAFKLDLTSTLSSGAMTGVLKMLKAGGSVDDLLAAAQKASTTINDQFGKNAASRADAYAAYMSDPDASQDLGLGLAFKQVQDILEAAGVPTGETLDDAVAEAFTAILSKLSSGDDLGSITLTADDVPSVLDLDLDGLKTGKITYRDPATNEVVSVTLDDTPDDNQVPTTETEVTLENEPDFRSDATKLAPTVDLYYNTADATSPLRLTVSQAGGTFDVKSIVATIPRAYVKAIDLDAATQINDTTTISNPTGALSGWSSLTLGQPHFVTATTATDSSFTGVWKFGAASPGTTTIADVGITADSGQVKMTLDFKLLNNNAIETKGGKVEMDILKSVIELDATALEKLPGNGNNVVAIIIKSRAGSDLSPTTTDTAAGVNYTRAITLQ